MKLPCVDYTKFRKEIKYLIYGLIFSTSCLLLALYIYFGLTEEIYVRGILIIASLFIISEYRLIIRTFKKSPSWFLKYWIHASFLLFATSLYILVIYQNIPEDSIKKWFNYIWQDEEGKKLFKEIALSFANLIFIAVLIKVVLAQRAFLSAVFEHFKTIFIKQEVQSIYSDDQLINLANNINKTNKFLTVNNQLLKEQSIQHIIEKWEDGNQEKDTIQIESNYTTTIYVSKKHEISHKKIHYRMMREGQLKFEYYFIPPDEDTDYTKYEDLDRWNDKSFKLHVYKIDDINKDLKVNINFSKDTFNGKEWIKVEVESDSDRECSLKKGDEFIVEFSLSHPINLSNTAEAKQRRKKYFHNEYKSPIAKRTITFQVETYDNNTSSLEPMLLVDSEPLKQEWKRNMYYKKWSWEVYWIEDKSEVLKLTVED